MTLVLRVSVGVLFLFSAWLKWHAYRTVGISDSFVWFVVAKQEGLLLALCLLEGALGSMMLAGFQMRVVALLAVTLVVTGTIGYYVWAAADETPRTKLCGCFGGTLPEVTPRVPVWGRAVILSLALLWLCVISSKEGVRSGREAVEAGDCTKTAS